MDVGVFFQTGRYSKQIATLSVLLYNKAVENRKKRKEHEKYFEIYMEFPAAASCEEAALQGIHVEG